MMMRSKILAAFVIFIAQPSIANAAMSFVHPGAIDTKENLTFVKQQIAAGKQPWITEFTLLKKSSLLNRSPHASTTVNAQNNNEANMMRDDALAAYSQALMWTFTNKEIYAKRAIAILNAWSSFTDFTSGSDQDKLQAGWIGAVFAPAAELMRGYGGWSEKEVSNFQAMFKKAFYPQLLTASSWNGNVDLTQIDALISIAVFNEDEVAFNKALSRLEQRSPAYFYLSTDGDKATGIEGDGGNVDHFWANPTQWVDGLTQETCRDNGHHSQYGLASALHAAEVAWNQGVDVYTANQKRYTAALELMAKQLLSNNFATCTKTAATKNRFNTWEIGFNHYHNRKGIELPYTQKLINEQIRTNSQRATWNIVYETLTHAELP